jgi:hypothetical protein
MLLAGDDGALHLPAGTEFLVCPLMAKLVRGIP